ncbi:MAG: hypothetical protein R3B65_01010 [Candidatus Paceibacterota bacterium]
MLHFNKPLNLKMKASVLLLFVLSNVHIFSQELIRWDFEDENGSFSLQPTYISDTSLFSVNPVAYSGIFPFNDGVTIGASSILGDHAVILRVGFPKY